MSEVAAQKRFRLHAVAPPPMVGVVLGGDATTLRVRTHVSRTPFAHGFQEGDVVRIARPDADGAVVHATPDPASDEEGKERTVPPTPATLPRECSCVVLATDADPTVLTLAVPRLAGLADAGTCVNVLGDVAAWNVRFGGERSLPPATLGFPRGATQWGVDGSVRDAGDRRLPPFEAPHVHTLDHPDYVLLTFSESASTAFAHVHQGEHRSIWCKLSLYPLFREERMLPRDTALQNGALEEFTIAFWNPDLRTPYEFHGAEFSLSLNFVVADGA